MVEYEKDYFQRIGYDGYRDFDAHKLRVEKIISMANPNSVLDVGCAYGFIVKRLLDKGIYAVGMDISGWCETMSKDIIPLNYVRHDMRITPYPFREQEFDLLYCEGVLEHIEEEYIPRIMNEFARVSKLRIIQVSFDDHKDVEKEEGHILLRDNGWWMSQVPLKTYVAYHEVSIENNWLWMYKG